MGRTGRRIKHLRVVERACRAIRDALGIDLIMIGTHQKGFWERFVFGSWSSDVSKHTKAAVLLVPPCLAE
jgi:nucleotide-binding universal stress UspA family protein